MKLWQKIFLTTLALMVLSTTLTSTLLLKSSRDALWQREGQRAVTQHQYLAGMLRAGVISHRLQLGQIQLDEAETRQTAAQVLARQNTDSYLSGMILLDGGGASLYSTMPEGLSALPDAPEDEPDPSKMKLDLEMFRAYTRGYLEAARGLEPLEIEMLPMGASR